MKSSTLLLLHGWGFDSRLWDEVCGALPDFPTVRWDRGYFGRPAQPPADAPLIAIGHSLGALLLTNMMPRETALIVINGFDRFTGEGAVPPRVVERMRSRFRQTPLAVLDEFRARCGAPPADRAPCETMLADDLTLLATHRAAATDRRMLVLHGAEDPILPPELRAAAFPDAPRRTHEQAGHLLPLTHAAWCAEQIRDFVCG